VKPSSEIPAFSISYTQKKKSLLIYTAAPLQQLLKLGKIKEYSCIKKFQKRIGTNNIYFWLGEQLYNYQAHILLKRSIHTKNIKKLTVQIFYLSFITHLSDILKK